jgi:Na+-driven multidrug efflux pump
MRWHGGMNAAYLHIVLNHAPIFLIPFAAIFLAHAIRTANENSRRFALAMLILAAGLAIPTYLTGEPAEDIVEKIQGISHDAIEEHEEAAVFALVGSILVGVTAVASMVLQGTKRKWSTRVLFVLVIWLITVLARVAYLGGFIRHTEIHEAPAAAEVSQ